MGDTCNRKVPLAHRLSGTHRRAVDGYRGRGGYPPGHLPRISPGQLGGEQRVGVSAVGSGMVRGGRGATPLSTQAG